MRSKKLKYLIYFSFFSAIMLILSTTPLGFVPIGPLRATTLHIPVILAGILFGKRFGAGIGFVFGFLSLVINTLSPTLTSFVFTPFISIGTTSGNFASLIIVFIPRILLGFLSGWIIELLSKKKINHYISVSFTAIFTTFIHSVLVLSLIVIFFGSPYSDVKELSVNQLWPFIGTILATNGIAEMILAGFIVPFLARALSPIIERSSL